MRAQSTDMSNAPITEVSQLRWHQVLAFGCLPDDGSVVPHGPTAAPATPASDILP